MTTKRGAIVTDGEMGAMHRIMREYALLPPDRRGIVAAYVNTRLGELPVLAAVGGGTEEQPVPMLQFPSREKPNHEDAAATEG